MRRHRPTLRQRLIALAIAAAVCVLATAAFAQQSISRQVLDIGSDAIGLAPATIRTASGAVATRCVGRLETADVRYWTSGTPTSTDGILLKVDEVIVITGTANLDGFRVIRTGSTNGKLPMECER